LTVLPPKPTSNEKYRTIERTLDELVLFARHIRTLPTAEVRAALPRLEEITDILTYHCIYGHRSPYVVDPPSNSSVNLEGRKCTILGCTNGPRLYNIGAQLKKVEWRCIEHIPPELTFPIGLWGDEWKATGRK
jgi:hypothetical protein